ncbi:response regulator [Robertkochia solimangrovi]|uniref:response regulator n=1 Tax=Robertkochia solimangrovi TaxID=2213046 RepID=UPI00118124EA|nr:response regulator [Robertkochia solimangrovi]TRZ41459.1 response regulator [Robertkochia solimangrovi]
MSSKQQILVIDDDTLSRFQVKKVIANAFSDSDILEFPEGSSAFNFLKSYDLIPGTNFLIFLDLFMPIMDGWKFLEKLPSINFPEKNAIQVFLLTSSFDPEIDTKVTEYRTTYGMNVTKIEKPVVASKLTGLVIP